MDVAVPVLGKVRDDRLARSVAAETRVLVIEHVGAVAHEIAPAVPLECMDAVLARTQQAIELEVTLVVIANRVIEEEPRGRQDAKLREVPPVPPGPGITTGRPQIDHLPVIGLPRW